ncbi:MAG: ABC transporter permease subunit [Candidatus Coproplasma sp.]
MQKLLKYDDFLVFDEATGTYSMPAEQQVRDETERKHWKTTGLTILKDWRLYVMLIPMILVYLLWKYLPMYELVASFKTGNESQAIDRDWVGISNFVMLFTNQLYSVAFWRAFRNTFILAFYSLLFGFPMPIILALFFNEVRSNIARSIMQVCVYLPKFLSTVIVTTLIIALFRGKSSLEGGADMGIVSRFLTLIWGEGSDLGIQAASSNGLIYSNRYFRAIYIVGDLWEHAGYDSIVFFAAVIAVSPTSYEAAQIDGAGKMQQMRYVVIPSILSTVVIMLIMKMGSLLSIGYEKLYLFCPSGTSGNYEVASVVSTLANEWGNEFGIAAEMVNNLIGMILVIGSNFIARKASNVSLY